MPVKDPLQSRVPFKTQMLGGVALLTVLSLTQPSLAYAQVTISDAQTEPLATSTADSGSAADLTLDSAASVSVTGTTAAVTLDSDNILDIDGDITITDDENEAGIDDAIGVNIIGGNTGTFTLGSTSAISITESYTREDDDEDGIVDGAYALGTGRTGILISGSAPFVGDFTTEAGSAIVVEGNDSYGVNLTDNASIDGTMIIDSAITMVGDNSIGVNIEAPASGVAAVTGSAEIDGAISSTGEGVQGINIEGDVGETLFLTGTTANTGYITTTRQSAAIRDLLNDDDKLQAGSAVTLAGDVGAGVQISSASSITQFGSAPALIVSGDISGDVATIIDIEDEEYDASLEYGFINEGTVVASGIFNDLSATGLRLQGTTIAEGFSNEGSIGASTYRSGQSGEAGEDTSDLAHATGIIATSGTTIANFENSGTITSSALEDADNIYTDDGTLAANDVFATTIHLESGAQVTSLTNSGVISSNITGRQGTAQAILDESGNLTSITNTGFIFTAGANSDPDSTDTSDLDLTLTALDLSANTTGVTITQEQAVDTDLTDDFTPVLPLITGNILLGSGDDTLTSSAGIITGGIDFGAGNDTLSLDETILLGDISNSAGLDIALTNGSALRPISATPTSITTLNVDETSSIYTFIDGDTNSASTLTASGAVTLADGASVTPVLANILSGDEAVPYDVISAGSLSLEGGLASIQPTDTPYIYNVDYTLSADTNTLIANLQIKDAADLGLDSAQLGQSNVVYNAVLENMRASDELGAAFAGLTNQSDFINAYNQVLPEFSSAASQYVMANVNGSTGSVSTKLDNARLSNERPAGAWIEEFGYYSDRALAGSSEAYRGYGFGFSGGLDTEFGPLHTAGINVAFAATEIEDVLGFDDPLNVETFQTGLYGGYLAGKLGVDAYLGGGYSQFESSRNVEIGSFNAASLGEWSGSHINGSIKAGYDLFISEKYFMRPSLGFSYLSLTEDAYTEDGDDSIRLSVSERTSEYGTATALLNFGAVFENDNRWWRPTARIGFRSQFMGDDIITEAGYVNTGTTFSIISQALPTEAAIFGLSLAVGTKYSSMGIDYDADIRDGYNLHTLRVVLRMLF